MTDGKGAAPQTAPHQHTNTDKDAGKNNFTNGDDPQDILSYLLAVFGDDTGFAVFALGINPRRNPKTGRYEHDYWSESSGKIAFAWPDEAEQICEAIEKYAPAGDLHVVPYLRRSEARAKGDAVRLRLVHTDCDNGLDQEKIGTLVELGVFVVGSGSPGNGHVYVPLSEPVSQAGHEALCKGLITYLNGDRAKHSDNDLLRPVGAYNLKATVFENSPARRVHWLVKPNDKRTDPRTLADLLAVDLDTAEKAQTNGQGKSKASDNGKEYGGNDWASLPRREVDLSTHFRVKLAIDTITGDRSQDISRIVGACLDSGLTIAHAYWAVAQREDLVEKLTELTHDDVERCWEKITESREEQSDTGQDDDFAERIVDGATFILSAPQTIPAVWGRDDEVLWSQGEALMIAGTVGLGKTTLAGLLVRALLTGGQVLGFPVVPVGEPILYLAMDRPLQIARSMRRQFHDQHQRWLSERLKVWQGPPQEDMAKNPELLRALARKAGARHLFVDSLKDAVIKLSDDEVGAAYNRARQLLIADGCQLCELHHLVKRASGDSIDDIYGSRWLTAGAGSLILLSGEPGDPIIKFKHVRPPATEVGPLRLLSVQETGEISIYSSVDLIELAKAAADSGGLTAKAAAGALFEIDKPTRAEIEKARRRVDKLTADGKLRQVEGHRGGQVGDGEARWLPA